MDFEWIDVNDRKPEDGKFVLVSLKDKSIEIAEYKNDTFYYPKSYNMDDGDVIAWMPLPDPYDPF